MYRRRAPENVMIPLLLFKIGFQILVPQSCPPPMDQFGFGYIIFLSNFGAKAVSGPLATSLDEDNSIRYARIELIFIANLPRFINLKTMAGVWKRGYRD
ncbi:hypothetical protein SUGI_1013100 [Cryptomeria japonica]|nr:hypothetical protein SUGI_1013100 [Cryptomeria japonica]